MPRHVKIPIGFAQFYQAEISFHRGEMIRSLEELEIDSEDLKLDGMELVELGLVIKDADFNLRQKSLLGLMIYGYRPDEIRKKLKMTEQEFRRTRKYIRQKLSVLLS